MSNFFPSRSGDLFGRGRSSRGKKLIQFNLFHFHFHRKIQFFSSLPSHLTQTSHIFMTTSDVQLQFRDTVGRYVSETKEYAFLLTISQNCD